MANGTETFYAELKYTSPNAYLFTDGVEDFWIPKSMTLEMTNKGSGNYEITIPYWLAKAKGII